MAILVRDLQDQRNRLDTQIKALEQQKAATDTLIAAMQSATAAGTLSAESGVGRKVYFTKERLHISTDQINWNEIAITEIIYRLHPELPPKFQLATLVSKIYEKLGRPLPFSENTKKIRNQTHSTIAKSAILKKMYSWTEDSSKGRSAPKRERIYTKNFVKIEDILAMMGGVSNE